MVGWSSGLGFCHWRFRSSPLREQRWLRQWRTNKNSICKRILCMLIITQAQVQCVFLTLVCTFISTFFLLTFHLQHHQGWAWGQSWRCRLLSGWLPVSLCPSETLVCPSLPSWHWSLQGALWLTGRSMDDSLKSEEEGEEEGEHSKNKQRTAE